jgi:hypothetical protein
MGKNLGGSTVFQKLPVSVSDRLFMYHLWCVYVPSSVPHPFAFFLAKGWETRDLRTQNHAVYSVFDSALNRMQDAEWQFPQEIATLHDTFDVNK